MNLLYTTRRTDPDQDSSGLKLKKAFKKMAALSELKGVLHDTLEARGALGQVKARIRADVYAALEEQALHHLRCPTKTFCSTSLYASTWPSTTTGIRSKYSCRRAGSRATRLFGPQQRTFLEELNVQHDPRAAHVPLLYSIVAGLQHHTRAERTATAACHVCAARRQTRCRRRWHGRRRGAAIGWFAPASETREWRIRSWSPWSRAPVYVDIRRRRRICEGNRPRRRFLPPRRATAAGAARWWCWHQH